MICLIGELTGPCGPLTWYPTGGTQGTSTLRNIVFSSNPDPEYSIITYLQPIATSGQTLCRTSVSKQILLVVKFLHSVLGLRG